MQRRPARVGSGDVDAERLPVVIESHGEGSSVPAPSTPGVTIVSGPPGTVESTDASFAMTSDPGGELQAPTGRRTVRVVHVAVGTERSANGDRVAEVRARADG